MSATRLNGMSQDQTLSGSVEFLSLYRSYLNPENGASLRASSRWSSGNVLSVPHPLSKTDRTRI